MTILMKAGGRLSLVRKWFKYLKILVDQTYSEGSPSAQVRPMGS